MSTRTFNIICMAIIIVGGVAISLFLRMRQDTPKPVIHQAVVEEQPQQTEEAPPPAPVEEQKPELKLHTGTAADAIFRAFGTSTAMCWDDASHTYFVYFDEVRPSETEFGYQAGWNIMGAYEFLVLGNGTATLKMAGHFSPIRFDANGLFCHQRGKK